MLETIHIDRLAGVVGGRTTQTLVTLGGVKQTTTLSPYEHCLEAGEQGVWAAYPDNRGIVPKIFGAPDPNAGPRLEAAKHIADTCGPPPG